MARAAMRRVAGVAGVLAATLGVTAGDAASGRGGNGAAETARVAGSGAFRLPFALDDDVRAFTLDARGVPYSRPVPGSPDGLPTDAVGTVATFHYDADDGTTASARADVDCLVTGPRTATLTAVTRGPGGPRLCSGWGASDVYKRPGPGRAVVGRGRPAGRRGAGRGRRLPGPGPVRTRRARRVHRAARGVGVTAPKRGRQGSRPVRETGTVRCAAQRARVTRRRWSVTRRSRTAWWAMPSCS